MLNPIVPIDSDSLKYELTPELRSRIMKEFKQFLKERPSMLSSNPKFAETIHAIGEDELSLAQTNFAYVRGYTQGEVRGRGHSRYDSTAVNTIDLSFKSEEFYMSAERDSYAPFEKFEKVAAEIDLNPYWPGTADGLASTTSKKLCQEVFSANKYEYESSTITTWEFIQTGRVIVYNKYPINAKVMTKKGMSSRTLGYYDAVKDTVEFHEIRVPLTGAQKARKIAIGLLVAAAVAAVILLLTKLL